MRTWSLAAIGIFPLMSFGCATAPDPNAPPPASVAGEWLGVATVGPKIGCCFGSSGPIRLMLEQRGGTVSGSLQGVGYRGRISASVAEKELQGSCDCQTSNLLGNVSIEGSISGNDMVFRIGDSRLTLTRTP